MYALFDDAGKFLAGRVISESDAALQVELESGKRVKVKSAHVLLRFEQTTASALLERARVMAGEIDLDLAWTFAPDSEFGFADFAREYFDASAGIEQQAAALLRLFEAPHYFRRTGRGRFRKAPEEVVKAALVAIERRRLVALQIEAWAADLVAGGCPAPVREQLYRILFKPDKNAPEYKAVVEASRRTRTAPLELLKVAGAIDSPYQFHWKRFLFEQFPQGVGFGPGLDAPTVRDSLPLASVQAFSIDDSATTEIDDALSIQGMGTGTVRLGIHIAAPALAIAQGAELDRVAAQRLSTVYMPGWKLTMLPDAVVEKYTLTQGRDCPAVSLYLTIDETTLDVLSHETRLEQVPIVANLRHDKLDSVVTQASLAGGEAAAYPFAAELAFAYRLARAQKARREAMRGKPENFNRPDYAFRLERHAGDENCEPRGNERVMITPRQRGAPLDLIVAEAMILANSTWGAWLAECAVPGIYRSQAGLSPGIKVRMGTKPLPHAGIGVAQYLWATSPLRRYVDLVNQWQIIACARHGRTAALAAPFKAKDSTLYSIISAFDAAYAAYADFQRSIERFWTLQWLSQQGVNEIDAVVMKDGLVRAEALPLVYKTSGCEALARGTRVRTRITSTDALTLDVHASLVAQLDGQPERADEAAEDEDAAAAATPLTLAIEVDEPPAASTVAP
jgi:exoribonuclease-2